MIYEAALDRQGRFTIECALKMFGPLQSSIPGLTLEEFAPIITLAFVHCQMTNLDDLGEPGSYFTLKFVEFLEYLCRIALVLHL